MENTNSSNSKNQFLLPFALVCSLFFLWGLANSLNGSLIRHFQFALDLNRFQAGIVDSAFYFGYFVMAIPAGIFMRKFGYKRGILAGLLLYAAGAGLFFPAAELRVYAFFLFALFTIASGLAFLETAANLYVTVLGDPKTSTRRINFAQSFNGISIILGPVIGSLFIFLSKEYSAAELAAMEPAARELVKSEAAHSVQMPYLFLAGLVLAVAVLFWLTPMPEVGREEESQERPVGIFEILGKYRHLTLGVLAQFFYVGAQATLWGYFVDFKLDFAQNDHLGIALAYSELFGKSVETATPEQIAGFHASFALVLFMLGRFVGTALMFRMDGRRVMLYFTMLALLLTGVGFATGGLTAIVSLSLVYFCMSIMFPTIFAMATDGLPPAEKKLASSLVIMAIVGGAVLPPLAGLLSGFGGMKMALLVPLVSFVYILWYVSRRD